MPSRVLPLVSVLLLVAGILNGGCRGQYSETLHYELLVPRSEKLPDRFLNDYEVCTTFCGNYWNWLLRWHDKEESENGTIYRAKRGFCRDDKEYEIHLRDKYDLIGKGWVFVLAVREADGEWGPWAPPDYWYADQSKPFTLKSDIRRHPSPPVGAGMRLRYRIVRQWVPGLFGQ